MIAVRQQIYSNKLFTFQFSTRQIIRKTQQKRSTSPTISAMVPLSPYGTFSGSIFQYNTFPSLVAFESSNLEKSPNKCILIGGLSDGLIPTPYSKDLESACHESGWSLVQPMISSSGLGFGHGTLQRDTEEIRNLLNYLVEHRNAEQIAFVGHSTGCQNAVHFMKYGDKDLRKKVKLVVLQAPVSDREGAMETPKYAENIEHARKLQAMGQEDEMMPRSAFWAPITAARFLSLQDVGGDDDFFSSDFSDEEMALRLKHLGQYGDLNGLKTLIAFSGEDEYVPTTVDKKKLVERLHMAMTSQTNPDVDSQSSPDTVDTLFLETGNHNLSNEEGDKELFVDTVKNLLKSALN